jgi:hypothetical protein
VPDTWAFQKLLCSFTRAPKISDIGKHLFCQYNVLSCYT